VAVRAAQATLALTPPRVVRPGRGFRLAVAGSAELERSLYVTLRPAGPPCGATYEIEAPQSEDVAGATLAVGPAAGRQARATVLVR